MSRETAVLAIDLGTTEVKAGLVGLDGRLLGLARAGYATDADPATGRAEQDPEAWWGAIAIAVRELVRLDVGEVCAIGIDGHGPTLVPVDAAGHATHAAVIWQDTRSSSEQDELAQATGLQGWSLAGLPAALWLERHDTAAAEATCWYLATWDAVAMRLTGRATTSLVVDQPFPDAGTLDRVGLPSAKVPPPIAAGSVVGELRAEAGAALGLRPGIPVVAGIVDAWASFHGAGMAHAGDAMDPGGSAGGFGVYCDRPLVVPGSFSTIAAPVTAVSRTAGTSTGKPVTSALIWFHVSLRAGPPQTRIARTSAPARTISSATWRIAKADASRIARVRWARPWLRASPTNAPRAVGSHRGERSPARYGRKTTPSAPDEMVPASSISASAGVPPPSTSSRNQSRARPVAAIAPPTENSPGSGAIVENEPGTTSGPLQ